RHCFIYNIIFSLFEARQCLLFNRIFSLFVCLYFRIYSCIFFLFICLYFCNFSCLWVIISGQNSIKPLNNSDQLSRTFDTNTYRDGARLACMIQTIMIAPIVVLMIGALAQTAYADISPGAQAARDDWAAGGQRDDSCNDHGYNSVDNPGFCIQFKIDYDT